MQPIQAKFKLNTAKLTKNSKFASSNFNLTFINSKMEMTSAQIRNTFLDFFQSKHHHIIPSAPIVVKDDPTLMFTNAGMNQFKEIFLGNMPAKFNRIADTQKCLRVSGKHNDLEEVGYDTYHHTMFEMLGNWSFGDYFKQEAIDWAWELLVDVLKIDKDRLYVTVYGGDKSDGLERDNEAYNYWKKHIAEDRILFGSKKDNFWEMGDTGPCGPCSEIHADIRSESDRKAVDGKTLVNNDHPLVIEIWNLVFIEFNRLSNGSLTKLPAQHVDTGMGFERLTMVLQGKKSNYDTDIFQPLIQELAHLAGLTYGVDSQKDIAMRVIADHLRAVAFAIADGQIPSNNGAGYVIRRILRRAVRYGYTFLGFEERFVYKLLSVLSDQMGSNFTEIVSQHELVSKVIFEEENSFLRTLSHGIRKFEQNIKSNPDQKLIDGNFAFELFDTYGFPIDLTKLLAKEKGLDVDLDGFQVKLEEQKNRSRKAAEVAAGDWVIIDNQSVKTEFVGYEASESMSKIIRYRQVVTKKISYFEIVLDVTPFYAESGGQVGDTGVLYDGSESIEIFNTLKENNLIVHLSEKIPQNVENEFIAKINTSRRTKIVTNHSATHLMHAALRCVLGTHVEQKGSLVDDERLRFDFSHFSKLTAEEIRKVERLVNGKIRENISANIATEVPVDKAKEMGAMALFGEKYGDFVRVVSFDPTYSIELCGGTHAASTGQIGSFRIISESAIAAGVRRIEAVTGEFADTFIDQQLDQLQGVRELIKSAGDVVKSTHQLIEQNHALQKQVEQLLNAKALEKANALLKTDILLGGVRFIETVLEEDGEFIKNVCGNMRSGQSNLIVSIGGKFEGKISLCLMITDDLVNMKNLDASKQIREAAKAIMGGGGGQKHLATAGGKNLDGMDQALEIIRKFVISCNS
jgi:alanyl-tRNA synthetase